MVCRPKYASYNGVGPNDARDTGIRKRYKKKKFNDTKSGDIRKKKKKTSCKNNKYFVGVCVAPASKSLAAGMHSGAGPEANERPNSGVTAREVTAVAVVSPPPCPSSTAAAAAAAEEGVRQSPVPARWTGVPESVARADPPGPIR